MPAAEPPESAEARPERKRLARRVGLWLARYIGLPLAAFLAVSLLLGAFLPVASTLMIGRWVSGQGVDRAWVPLEQMAPALRRAVIASEDQRFCQHWGVDVEALVEVLSQEGGPSRGASTVSMQVAKNLYLWPGRSYVRKALEIPLAFVIDRVWGKRRVMEVYLNVAEWGDGVFGAEAAARRYFRKTANALEATEAARLVAALPNPLEREPDQRSAHSKRVRGRMEGIEPLARCVLD
ncbi:MAG: monofunctional biosynthetic peptidoglycan transglycosylase [Proteobacteria bacterium]|nr:monofunctional biosynthetic peptidoglycan transglycosylase [Pseudomonadota bacterium]